MNFQYQQIIKYIDLTNLEKNLNEEDLISLCDKANNTTHKVAAICVENEYVPFCKKRLLGSGILVASVYNFPFGTQDLIEVKDNIEKGIAEGVDELDIVLPITQLMKSDNLKEFYSIAFNYVSALREHAPALPLKFIISTGVLNDNQLIKTAANAVIDGKGDFVKTCTGKNGDEVTLEHIKTVLSCIATAKNLVGFKASGGVRTPAFAMEIVNEANKIYSHSLSSQHLRIGASKLFDLII